MKIRLKMKKKINNNIVYLDEIKNLKKIINDFIKIYKIIRFRIYFYSFRIRLLYLIYILIIFKAVFR